MKLKIFFIPLILNLSFINTVAQSLETIVTSDTLDLITEGSNQEFLFKGNVKIEDPKWTLTCDNLNVQSTAPQDLKNSNNSHKSSVHIIIANGNVLIQQSNRQATAGIAEIYPNEGKIILKKNPSVTHAEGKIEGYQIVFYIDNQNDGTPGKIIVEGNPNEPKERPKVTLPALNDHFNEKSSMEAAPSISQSS